MIYALFMIGAILCAVMVMVARSLLASTVWLAAISVQIAILMYLMGAHTVAVIELSVGAGLVTVLFVFAISTAGDDTKEPAKLSRPLIVIAMACAFIVTALLIWFILPAPPPATASPLIEPTFSQIIWQERSMDTLLQVVLLSAGAMSVLGLIANHAVEQTSQKTSSEPPSDAEGGV